MVQTNLKARILAYLDRAVTGDLLRSERDIANAVGATVEDVHEAVRELVRAGDVFEPIPRRYLRHDRRLAERRKSARPGSPERRRSSSGASGGG